MKSGIWHVVASGLIFGLCGEIRAQESFNIKINGRIVPRACTIHADGNENINYGEIDVAHLNARKDQPTKLPDRNVGFEIDCPGGRFIAIKSTDNDPYTDSEEMNGNPDLHEPERYVRLIYRRDAGLRDYQGALKDGTRGSYVGLYKLSVSGLRAKPKGGLYRDCSPVWRDIDSGDEPWRAMPDNDLNYGNRQMAWSCDGGVPMSAEHFRGTITVKSLIFPTRELDTKDAIEFSGESAITIEY